MSHHRLSRPFSRPRATAVFLILAVAAALAACQAPPKAPVASQFAPPPAGWASWNSFGNAYDSRTVQQQAEALTATGMQAAGYTILLLDEGWWLGERDAEGNIVVDKDQWPAIAPGDVPGDMANIVRYLHARGFKAGIYTDAGPFGCSFSGPDTGGPRPNTGSYGHYRRDFLQFAKWGFDYVKVDWCGGTNKPGLALDPAAQYAEIARIIGDVEAETGGHLIYSICNWGRQWPWTWAPGIGGLTEVIWRAGEDITDPILIPGLLPKHDERSITAAAVYRVFDHGLHHEAQHTGYFNDLDMMVVGMRGTDERLDRLHLSLWAIAGSPLMAGSDITKLTPAQAAVYTNPGALAIARDPAGLQGCRVPETPDGLDIYVKPLAGIGQRAVLFLNRSGSVAEMSLEAGRMGLTPGSAFESRDVWASPDGPAVSASLLKARVDPDSAALFRVSGDEPPRRSYVPSATITNASLKGGGLCARPVKDRKYQIFDGLEGDGRVARIFIDYRPAGGVPDMISMQVNEIHPTVVQLRPASEGIEQTIVVQAELKPGTGNTIRFWKTDGGPSPVFRLSVARD